MKYSLFLSFSLLAVTACQTKTEEKTTVATQSDTIATSVKTPSENEKMCFEKRFKKTCKA